MSTEINCRYNSKYTFRDSHLTANLHLNIRKYSFILLLEVQCTNSCTGRLTIEAYKGASHSGGGNLGRWPTGPQIRAYREGEGGQDHRGLASQMG